MISIRTNVDSLRAQQNLNINSAAQSKTIQQLTSGYRINSSGDDAAGLAIANGYRNNTVELNQGVANANDAVGQLQTIDGGLSNISTILDRMKTLATQSASGTFTGNRNTLSAEFTQLSSEIDRQASNVGLNFGGTQNANLQVYIGGASTATNAQVSVDLSNTTTTNSVDSSSLGVNANAATNGTTTVAGTGAKLDITTAAGAQTAITAIDNAVKQLGLTQGAVGAGENKLQYATSLAQSQISNFSAAESQIRDADVAAAAANLSKSQVLQQTSVAAMAQANQESQSVLKLLQ